MSLRGFSQAIGKAAREVDRKHLLAFSGSLAYYYFLALLPLLILQRKFWRTVPGSIVAVTTWIAASYGLGFYLQHVGDLSKSYETLGAIAGLLLWFYLSSAAILIGAEVNAELLEAAYEKLPAKEVPKSASETTLAG